MLGESHYSTNRDASPEFTRKLTDDYVNGRMRHRFWTSVARLVVGNQIGFEERAAFWGEIAFYNYIQEIVGPHTKIRPTEAAWARARQPFMEVLGRLKPHAVLVLGKALWSRLPEGDAHALTISGRMWPARLYDDGAGGRSMATYVKHPASLGFSWRKWHETAAGLLLASSRTSAAT